MSTTSIFKRLALNKFRWWFGALLLCVVASWLVLAQAFAKEEAIAEYGVSDTPAAATADGAPWLWLDTSDDASNNGSRMRGVLYLVPKPLADVRASFEADRAFATGFKAGKQLTFALNGAADGWKTVYFQSHPELFAQAKTADVQALAKAHSQQAITDAELARWTQAIRATRHVDWRTDDAPIDFPPIAHAVFRRDSLGSLEADRGDYFNREVLILRDMAGLLGRSTPLTLVWYGTERTEQVKTHFALTSCMTGVTCFPDPHWETATHTGTWLQALGFAQVSAFAQRLGAQAATEAVRLKQMLESDDRSDAQAPASQIGQQQADAPIVQPAVMPLAGFESVNPNDIPSAMKPLPDGSMLTEIGTPGAGFKRLWLEQGRIQSSPVELEEDVTQVRVAGDGAVWALTATERNDKEQSYKYCLRSWRQGALKRNPRHCWRSVIPPTFIMHAQAGPMLYFNAHVATGDTLPERMVAPLQDRLWLVGPLWQQRQQAARKVPLDSRVLGLNNGVDLGNGLFWFADHNLYGVSALTGKVAQSLPTLPYPGLFGSVAGDWMLTKNAYSEGNQTFGVVRLSGKGPDVALHAKSVHYTSALARTAHGRLLATTTHVAFNAPVLVEVWDMAQQAKNVARIQLPLRVQPVSIAFDWSGSRLWVHVQPQTRHNDEVLNQPGMLVWEVPATLRDAADANNLPDQRIGKNSDDFIH